MEKARNSSLLKIICYIAIPILVAILGLSMFHMAFLSEYEEYGTETEYVKTEIFAENYFSIVRNKVLNCARSENYIDRYYIPIEKENGSHYYYSDTADSLDYFGGIPFYIDYIIINQKTNEMYTNIKSNNYEQEITNMKNKEIFWNFNDGKIDTNIELINQENIKYNYGYYYTMTEGENELAKFEVYTSYNKEKTGQSNSISLNGKIFQYMLEHKNTPIYASTISLALLVIITVYLFWAIGHKKEGKEISLNAIDNIPYEILVIIGLTIAAIFLSIVANIGNLINYISLILITIIYLICYAVCAVIGVSTIKRIKAKKFLRSFLIVKIIRWFYRKIRKIAKEFSQKTSSSRKLFWYYWGFVVISIILATTFYTGIGLLLLFAFWGWSYYKLRKYNRQEEKIKQALQNIYEGKTDVYIEDEELTGLLKEMTIYVNDIAGGFTNAIEQSLKSERLKTELITNVSHDIKTPLTSIINYVDLLKTENIQNEKVKEYIEILDNKSQRLKKLTEDLVEASKVSSGNVKLNIEEINVKELINQTIGEFKDRFESKKLKIETQMPSGEIKIKADNRYMYRIIENLFSNITKYALDGSRVYIDVKEEKQQLIISMKNISKDKLNISSDELMQRFVRGDRSRYTEGSGLGLSIARSLTELQKGEFNLVIDGDLFKVEMKWNKI